jgi:hypothetical protein
VVGAFAPYGRQHPRARKGSHMSQLIDTARKAPEDHVYQSTDKHLREMRLRLEGAFPAESADYIQRLVDLAWARTANARVQQYRELLAERHSRDVLRRRASSIGHGARSIPSSSLACTSRAHRCGPAHDVSPALSDDQIALTP